MKLRFILTPLFLLSLSISSLRAQVVINEYSTTNLSAFVDSYGEFEDWIELYNAGASTVSLTGYYLSDDPLNPTKWKINSNLSITSSGFLRFWTSGRDTGMHTNFKLTQSKADPDWIVFSDANGSLIEKVHIERAQRNHSRGRKPNGSNTWGIFTTPSPNASNNANQLFSRYAATPSMNLEAGFYYAKQNVTITNTEPTSKVYYTTNGAPPATTSKLYSAAIKVDSTTVIKAYVVSTNATVLPSFIDFNTYFINVSHTMPVVSAAGTDMQNLLNGNSALVPTGSFEYFNKAKKRTATSYGDYNKHGQDSWANDQRSMDFASHDEYGYNYTIQEKLFHISKRNEFQGIILRAAGDDNYPAAHHASNDGSAHIRDAYVENLSAEGNLNLDVRIAEKAIVYVDGKYWGVYDMRARPDNHDYTNYYYDQDKYNLQYILTWGGTWAEYGGGKALSDWQTLYNFITTKDLSIDSNYNYVASQLDVTSLTDYIVLNSVTVTTDWLNYNTGWWRGMNKDGGHTKWGYTLWDNDAVFGFYINYTGVPDTSSSALPCNVETGGLSDPEGHLEILKKLRKNKAFDQYYVSRYIDLMNTTFSCDNMLYTLDSTINMLKPEMTQHAKRWFGTYTEWTKNAQKLRNFIQKRCNFMAGGIKSCYKTKGPYKKVFDVSPANSGDIKINSLTFNQFPYAGTYYGNIDVLLKATPKKGYIFDYWEVKRDTLKTSNTNPKTVMRIYAGDTVIAHYKVSNNTTTLNFTEINYKSEARLNSGSWLELSNYGNATIDLSGWAIKSGSLWKNYIFPSGTSINAGERLLLVNDTARFKKIYGNLNNITRIGFSFSTVQEGLYLYDTNGTAVVTVEFENNQPWPLAANGAGRTMELKADSLDASDPQNWRNGCIGGSPGNPFSPCNELLTVSEINYNASKIYNSGDWIELYNHHTDTLDLSGFGLRTSLFDSLYIFTTGTKLPPNTYTVLSADTAKFKKYYPNIGNLISINQISLSKSGDPIKIYNTHDSLVYSMVYEDHGFFPASADGKGYTIEYNNYNDDYSFGKCWSSNCLGGSPGQATGTCEGGIIFTEINYKSAAFHNAGDWVEIYNKNNSNYNLSGWTFVDGDSGSVAMTIPNGTILPAHSYLVLAADSTKFHKLYPNVSNVIYNFKFGLGSNGDDLQLYNTNSRLINIMHYGDSLPWPSSAASQGYTLELKDTEAYQSDGNNWFAGCIGGSPGTIYIPCSDSIFASEINYKSHPKADAGDWIELWNASKTDVNISGWILQDADPKDSFVIPTNTIIKAKERLVLANNKAKFANIFPQITPLGFFKFGLSDSNEYVILHDANQRIRFGMSYNTDTTWSTAANGTSYTMELDTNKMSFNYISPKIWTIGCPNGSPAAKRNSACDGTLKITEINYKSDVNLDSRDWLELSNTGKTPVLSAGWTIKNSSTSYVLPSNQHLLFEGDNVVVVFDSVQFKKLNPNINFTGSYKLSLSDIGDTLKVYSPAQQLKDIVYYQPSNVVGWPEAADGNGFTLERRNTINIAITATDWFAGCLGGSPGTAYTPCNYDLAISEINYRYSPSYPNSNYIELSNKSKNNINLSGYKILDNSGFNVFTFPANASIKAGGYLVVSNDSVALRNAAGTIEISGNLLFAIDSVDRIKVLDAAQKCIFHTQIKNQLPWPLKGNGDGYTLEATDSTNSIFTAAYWTNGCYGGSPGASLQPCSTPITFTEINYKSHPKADMGDWLEIYNDANVEIDLSGWKINDNSAHTFVMPQNTKLPAHSYLVIVEDTTRFKTFHPLKNINYLSGLFDLNTKGNLEVFNAANKWLFTFSYDSSNTWPSANENAYTLEKISNSANINLATNWQTGCPAGSPGTAHQPCTATVSVAEIRYNGDAAINSGDWIELLNTGNTPASINHYKMSNNDSSIKYEIIYNKPLFANERIVLAADLNKFNILYSSQNVLGSTLINLNDTGDIIYLFDEQGNKVSTTPFSAGGNWPGEANNTGKTLEWDESNNTNAENWRSGCIGGSPSTAFQPCVYPLIISEINYHSSPVFDVNDWIELHNTTNDYIKLDNYKIITKSGNYNFTTPITIPAYGYYVIAQNKTTFLGKWNSVTNVNENGIVVEGDDYISIKDSIDKTIYYIKNKMTTPWPINADGTGKTIELYDTAKDFSAGFNWFGGCFGGTPGKAYSLPCDFNGIQNATASSWFKLYPNPTDRNIFIESNSLELKYIKIYNELGALVYIDTFNSNRKELQVSNLANGIYTIEVSGEKESNRQRFVISK
jgi:hypothetical protein